MKNIFNTLAIIILMLFVALARPVNLARAQDETGTGYAGEETGHSDYIIYTEEKRTRGNYLLPLNYLFNAAFDSAQVPTAFKQSGYFQGYKNVFDIIVDLPGSVQEGGGWGTLFLNEWATTSAIPNYTLHLIGGGYDFRLIAEFYEFHGVPVPYLFSFITCYATNLSNEALENSNLYRSPHDPIADLLFFDLVGKFMFISNDVSRFFHNTLRLRNWMGQPMFDVRKTRIYNASCNYVLRPYMYRNMANLFIMMGYNTMVGAGFRMNGTDSLTFSGGVAVTGAFNPKNKTFSDSMKRFRPCGGIFYDRNGNLLASLILNGTENFRVRLNIYPDLLNIEYVNFGIFLGVDDYNHFSAGFTMFSLIGLSVTM
jgi:hypothetical protein